LIRADLLVAEFIRAALYAAARVRADVRAAPLVRAHVLVTAIVRADVLTAREPRPDDRVEWWRLLRRARPSSVAHERQVPKYAPHQRAPTNAYAGAARRKVTISLTS